MKKSPPYKNPYLAVEERVEDLMNRMTQEEKFWQLFMIPGDLSDGKERYCHGLFGFQVATSSTSENEMEQMMEYAEGSSARNTAELINEIQRFFIEETRLGIPIIPFDEALHGLIRTGATAFPQSIALAATWNTQLVADVAKAIALETRSRGIRQVLSPVINIALDVRWGRTEETYGEDPFLTTQMGSAFIRSCEAEGVITTPKHFVANVGQGGRDSYPIDANRRFLEEVCFPAFKAAICKQSARSIMTSYNSLDGVPCSAHDALLNTILKKEWGFDGFVVSDAGSIGGATVLHNTAEDFTEATAQAIEGGQDVIFQTSYHHYPLFYQAFSSGAIDQQAVDNAVRRVLRAKFQLGLFDDPYVNPDEAERLNGAEEHRALATQAARQSIVLLKNTSKLLPLTKPLRSIAVIGQDAAEARLGGYSGPGNHPVSILQGIQSRVQDSGMVTYVPGCKREPVQHVCIPGEYLYHMAQDARRSGLVGTYYNSIAHLGEPVLRRIDPVIDFCWTISSPSPGCVNNDFYSVHWEGILASPGNGTYEIGVKGDDGYRLYIDDDLLIDNWHKQSSGQITRLWEFHQDAEYRLRLEFFETTGNAHLQLIWNAGVNDEDTSGIEQAVAIAADADVAIVVAGITEGEFQDRAFLTLPGRQEELIARVAATQTPVVVVLVGGSAVVMNAWKDAVQSIVQVWYPGETGGYAVADVLLGAYNPAGRLPITYPIAEAQLPLCYNHKPTGRGDDYVNLTGKPLFPFGFGLSYTTFAYSHLQILPSRITENQYVKIRCTLQNTGEYDGDEVVQLYVRDCRSSVVRPVMELKGFTRVHIHQGETKEVTIQLAASDLALLDKAMKLVVEPGEYRIMVGASSRDIRLIGTLEVTAE